MSEERQEFVTVLPIASLRTGLAFVKGEKVGAKALALAAENVFSYAASQFLPDEIQVFTGPTVMAGHSIDQAGSVAAFEAVLPDGDGTMKAGVGKLPWGTILKTLLPFLLGLL